jgi:hypothetical protein
MSTTNERIRRLRNKAAELSVRCDAVAMEHRNLAAALDNFMVDVYELVDSLLPPHVPQTSHANTGDGFRDG